MTAVATVEGEPFTAVERQQWVRQGVITEAELEPWTRSSFASATEQAKRWRPDAIAAVWHRERVARGRERYPEWEPWDLAECKWSGYRVLKDESNGIERQTRVTGQEQLAGKYGWAMLPASWVLDWLDKVAPPGWVRPRKPEEVVTA